MRKELKDHLRDYATEAFRYYARMGCPTYEQLKQKIYNEALQESKREIIKSGNIAKPTEFAVINAERAVDNRKGELLDILAVERIMKIVKQDMRQAIEIVYFTDADRPLEKGDISMRVHKAGLKIPEGTATIYRNLSKARRMFAEERGLRLYNKFPQKLIVQEGRQVV